ncbi:MAG: hypothetical protein JRJ60_07260 [Deltaproteobacteria bacterium]|nr:hypothetical protein [Deltaproteobacteria bacterium]
MTEKETGRHRAIIILGMHRSGTSALSGVLKLLGVELGSRLFLPEPGVNDKGFWEHEGIVRTHDRLLTALDSNWDDVFPLPDNWWKSEAAAPYAGELNEILAGEFSEAPLWSVKDPRMCRLVPMWLELLASRKTDPLFVIMVRDPVEVARSLGKRDDFQEEKSYLLWLEHVCESVKWSRGYPRALITYDRLLDDWRSALADVAGDLSIAWPKALESAATDIDRFLEPGLRHHRVDKTQWQESVVPPWVADTYAAVVAPGALQSGRVLERVMDFSSRLDNANEIYGGWGRRVVSCTINELRTGFSQAIDYIAERDKELKEKDALIEDLNGGLSEAMNQLGIQDGELRRTIFELGRTGADLGQAQADLRHKEAELVLMRSSRFWRLGQWLQRSWIGGLLRIVSGQRKPG